MLSRIVFLGLALLLVAGQVFGDNSAGLSQVKNYAGMVQVDGENSLFYWLFPKQGLEVVAPLVADDLISFSPQ